MTAPSSTPLVRFVVLAAVLAGCERLPEPSRDWTPEDHDRAEEGAKVASGMQAAAQGGGDGGRGPAGRRPSAEEEAAALADLAWRQQCATCHGAGGRGDGPTGPMVQAPNLTDPAWQAKATDAEIAAVIKNGKGKMPKLDLPDRVVAALVGRVRAVRAK